MGNNVMNDFYRNLLNIYNENLSNFLLNNSEYYEWKRNDSVNVLTILHARCGIDVEGEVEKIVSHPKYRRAVHLDKLIEDIVTMVDERCGCFNPYVNDDLPEEEALDSIISMCKDKMYLMQKLRAGKKKYVLCNLKLIQRQVHESGICKIQDDANIIEIQEATKRRSIPKESDSMQEEQDTIVDTVADEEDYVDFEDETAGYLYRALRKKSRSNFVSILLSSEQVRQARIKNNKHLPYEYVEATKNVRIAGLLSPNNIFNEDQKISYRKYRGFVVRYHRTLQEVWTKYGQAENRNIQCMDMYLSEMLYGFKLADYMLDTVKKNKKLKEKKARTIARIAAQLIQIPDLSARKLYAEMMMRVLLSENVNDAKTREMDIEQFIQFESKVYYPILMTCVLECLYILKKRRGYDVSENLNTINLTYRFQNYFKEEYITDDKKRPFVNSPYADATLKCFYQTVKEEYYNIEGFSASIGQKCYDIQLTPHQMLQGIQYVLCGGKFYEPPSRSKLPPIPKNEYYIADNDEAIGPFELSSIKQKVKCGQLRRGTFVFKQGTDNWKRAERFEELADVFDSVVPPIPSEMQ